MALIKITRGGCGIVYTDENGVKRHALKLPEHGAFECDDAQAANLVAQRVAQYVAADLSNTLHQTDAKQDADDTDPAEGGKLTGHLDAAELETWDYNDLKKLAADMGIKPDGQKKADYIAALAAAEVEIDEADIVEDEEDADDLPDLNVADPE